MKLPQTFLIACLGVAPLCAQQVEIKVETEKSANGAATATGSPNGTVKIEGNTSINRSGHHQAQANGMPQQEKKPVAYIGVLTREVPPELRAQFSLAEGFGLLVDEVMPDSPAKAAGLKRYDVLVKWEDQQLVNMEQLMSLVHTKKKGDVVQLDVITGGKETKMPVTLGEHLIAANDQHQQHHGYTGWTQPNLLPFSHDEAFRGGEQRGFQHQGNAIHEQVERFQQQMREYQQRMQEWSKSGGRGSPMPQPPVLNLPGGQQQHGQRHNNNHAAQMPQIGISNPQVGVLVAPAPGGNMSPQLNFSHSIAVSNVTQKDDSGEYTLKNEDGKSIFVVSPKNGKEQSWPVNNDAERKAVPQEYQDKLKMMNGAGSGIHLEFNPGTLKLAPDNGASKPAPQPAAPPVKGSTTSA